MGRDLIVELGIDKHLGIENLKDIVMCNDIIGIWSQLKMRDEYPFSKLEKETIFKIREMLEMDIDSYSVYKYGLYVSSVVGSIKGLVIKRLMIYIVIWLYIQERILK